MFFRMQTDDLQLTTYVEKTFGPAIFKLTGGVLYSAKAEKLPFRFSYRDRQGSGPADYIDGDCLMSRRLVRTIEGAGVDSLQKYEAELTDEKTGEVNREFQVVNIIGLVAAADLSKSDSLPLGGGQVFTDLTIDEKKARGLLIFRLAESFDVIVHERVANAVAAGDFRGVQLTPVS